MRHVYSCVFLAMATSGFYLVAHSCPDEPRFAVGAAVGLFGLIMFFLS